ncbi:DnaJ sub C member 27 [Clydaea vesicula]|uniref:DnaJ sub C member 27 n=1 Tax=Clydaea vesicula TaxID=447962 RepID=A0AAD5U3A2_9FUNG|nr:DnaJ sub C member 27 [Clydaea vesicula]
MSAVNSAKRLKILSLGDSGVGKSCLIKRYCESRFIQDYISTIGIDYGVKSLTLGGVDLKINFWDVSGDPTYLEVRNEFYKDTLGAVLVYDVTSGKSFDALDKWLDELKKLSGNNNVIVVLVANKIDGDPRVISTEEGMGFAEKKGLKYFETSSQTGKGVKEMFENLFEAIILKLNNS